MTLTICFSGCKLNKFDTFYRVATHSGNSGKLKEVLIFSKKFREVSRLKNLSKFLARFFNEI